MGTHAYLFCPTANMPTLRDMFDWVTAKGFKLKLHADAFDDDEEEAEFLWENMDSTKWGEAPLADMQERWVVTINYRPKDDRYFAEDMDMLKKRVVPLPSSPERDAVLKRLNSAVLFVDIQFNVRDREVWPAQDAIMNYFFEQTDAVAYLENVGTFVQGQKTLLNTSV